MLASVVTTTRSLTANTPTPKGGCPRAAHIDRWHNPPTGRTSAAVYSICGRMSRTHRRGRPTAPRYLRVRRARDMSDLLANKAPALQAVIDRLICAIGPDRAAVVDDFN